MKFIKSNKEFHRLICTHDLRRDDLVKKLPFCCGKNVLLENFNLRLVFKF